MRRAPSAGFRASHWPLMGLAVAAALTVPVAHSRAASAVNDPRDLSGMWLNAAPAGRLMPTTGGAPPLNAAGKAAYAKAQADLKSGKDVDAVAKYCLPEGVPRLMSSAYPMKFIQAQKQLAVVHESHHTYRIVLMDAAHPAEDDITMSYMGDSVGHWDGNALVIDTVGFNANEPLDATGLPHGEKLHVVERLSRTATGLVDLITIEDPEFYARPWTVKVAYRSRPDLSIQEYACGEPHRILLKANAK